MWVPCLKNDLNVLLWFGSLGVPCCAGRGQRCALLVFACAVGAVVGQTPHLLGNFTVTNPSFLLLDTFQGTEPYNLVRGCVCAWG
jgi:hypothetical protein